MAKPRRTLAEIETPIFRVIAPAGSMPILGWEISTRASDGVLFVRELRREVLNLGYSRIVTKRTPWRRAAEDERRALKRVPSYLSRGNARLPQVDKETETMPKWDKTLIREGDEILLRVPIHSTRSKGLSVTIGDGATAALSNLLAQGAVVEVKHRIGVGDTVRKQGTTTEASVKALLDEEGEVLSDVSRVEAAHFALIKYRDGGPHTHPIAHLDLVACA